MDIASLVWDSISVSKDRKRFVVTDEGSSRKVCDQLVELRAQMADSRVRAASRD